MLRRTLFLAACSLSGLTGQIPNQRTREDEKEPDGRLPNGKIQRDEILKAEHEKSLQDATSLLNLSESLKVDLEKEGTFVVSLITIKKTEEIEKLAKRIRSRLKRA